MTRLSILGSEARRDDDNSHRSGGRYPPVPSRAVHQPRQLLWQCVCAGGRTDWRSNRLCERRYASMDSGVQAAMSEQQLNSANVGSVLQQVDGKSVAERVWCDGFGNARQLQRLLAGVLHAVLGDRLIWTVTGK
jgi:hypothetical protein